MMKRILVAGAAMAAVAAFAGAAAAHGVDNDGPNNQNNAPAGVNGTLHISGTVDSACSAGSWDTSIPLGNIIKSDGTLDTSKVEGKSNQSAVKFWCNSPTSQYTVVVNPLVGSNSAGNAQGFSNQVTYTVGTNLPGDHADGAAHTLGLFNNYVNIQLHNPATVGGASTLLVAGSYAGSVVVTVTPGA